MQLRINKRKRTITLRVWDRPKEFECCLEQQDILFLYDKKTVRSAIKKTKNTQTLTITNFHKYTFANKNDFILAKLILNEQEIKTWN